MNNNVNVMLITQTRIKLDKTDAFEQMLKKMNDEINMFPGYLSQEIHHPNPPLQLDWIIIQHFDSAAAAKSWLQSDKRHDISAQALPLSIGIDNVYIMQPGQHDRGTISATIANKIDPQDEAKFRDWQLRIAPLQSKFPGFIGYKLERPQTGINESWVAIVTFDSQEHLDAWLNSPERLKMIEELHTFTGQSSIEKVYAGFNFWFTDSKGSTRSVWKENMLVLLTLYPVVFLLSYVQNPVMAHGVPFWLALFFSNLISTIILGSLTVPWLMQKFQWWLNPQKGSENRDTILGALVVLLLYAIALFACWLLSNFFI
ncbi:MAG: antibiotic biosynthesis monooxygenase [Candidatus Babeliales bacterium]|nr:antibiotic biosynthesis monooxygenase [Candidatus Babeliales bacterium]